MRRHVQGVTNKAVAPLDLEHAGSLSLLLSHFLSQAPISISFEEHLEFLWSDLDLELSTNDKVEVIKQKINKLLHCVDGQIKKKRTKN